MFQPSLPAPRHSLVLASLTFIVGCGAGANELDDCPVDASFDENAVHGSILYCEDVDGETCYGDGCDCWDTPPRARDLRVMIESHRRADPVEAVVCYDDERRAQFEAEGLRNPGFPFLFAYVSDGLKPEQDVVVWSTDFRNRGLPSAGDNCWGRKKVSLDANAVATVQLEDGDLGNCQ